MSASSIAREAKRTPQWFPDLPQLLERALQRYDPDERGDFQDLKALGPQVTIGKMSVHGEFSVISDDCWIAPGSISATLAYEPESNERTEFSDLFPILVYYTVTDHDVQIKKIDVDLTSFDN